MLIPKLVVQLPLVAYAGALFQK